MRFSKLIQCSVVTSTLAWSLIFVGCGKSSDKRDQKDGINENIEDLGDIPTDELNGNEDVPTEISEGLSIDSTIASARPKVRNYTGFLNTYASLLELDPHGEAIAAEFRDLATNLPTTTDVDDFLGSHQLSLVKLGSYLCNHAYTTKSAEERQKLFGLDPASPAPIDAFGAINAVEMGKTIMSRFWGIEKSSITNTDSNLQTLTSMLSSSMAFLEEFNASLADADRVRLGTNALCTAALTSAQVSFYGY